MMQKYVKYVRHLQIYCQKWWYQPLVFVLAAVDHYVFFIPVDGLLVSSVLLRPRQWFSLAVCFTMGSTAGLLGFVWILNELGLDKLMAWFPALFESSIWDFAQDFFQRHGSWVVLLSGASPFPQQPAVIVTALAQVPFWTIAGMLILGRFLKFLLIAYVSSFAPQKLSRLWGIQAELEEMHISPLKISQKDDSKPK